MGAHDDLELTSLLSSRTLIRNFPDVTWIKAADGTYLACNAGFELLVGVSEGEIVGKTDYDLLERDFADAFRKRDRQVLASATPTVQESWVASQDGTRKLLQTVLTPLHQGGQIAGMLCVARDITPVRADEPATQGDSSEQDAALRRVLFQNARDGVVVLDAEGAVYDSNPRFVDMLGYSAEELREKHVWDWDVLLTRDRIQRWLSIFAPSHGFETRHRRKDGTVIDVDINVLTVDSAGRKLVYCVCRDISQRKAAEQALRTREEVYGAIIKHADDGIVLIDTQTLRFAEFNDAACRELGYTREEFAELTVADVQGVLTAEEVRSLVARALQTGAAKFETKHRMKSGALRERHISHRLVQIAERSYLASIWHDITEATRANEEMRATEARNSSLVSALAEGVLLIGADGRIETCNPAAQRILGMSVAEMSGLVEPTQQWQPIGEDGAILHPQYLPPLQTLTTGQPQHGVIVGVRKRNGAQIWVSMNAVPIFAEQGRGPVAVVASFVDITERRTVEQQLRKLSLAVAQSPHSVVITDLNARVEYVNDAFLESTRADPADVLGRKLFEQAAHSAHANHTELWRALQDGTLWEGELVNYRNGGERYIDHARVTPIHQPDGRITHCVTILEDITERKTNAAELERHRHHLEEMVAERTEQLQAANRIVSDRAAEISDLYNHAPCGYHSVDTNANIVAMNDTELTWLGYSREEVIGRLNLRQLIAPQWLPRFDEVFAQFKKTGSVHNLETDFVRKDGSLLPVVLSSTALLDAQGNYLSSRTTVFDNTERRAREQQIAALNVELERRAGDAESANRAKSAFLANMSHEIRTPMNAILGLTHLLRGRVAEPDQLDKLQKITHSAQHLLTIINNVLDISKIEAGKFQLERSDFELETVLHHVCSVIGAQTQAKGLELVVDIERALRSVLYGDATRLSQALLNYAANAVKFTARGSVVMRARVLEQSDADLLVRFEVKDSGIGISAEQMPRLFNAFEQADSSTTRQYGGTGLGLAISRRLAELMGGEAGAESRVGEGSTFWLTARLGKSARAPLRRPAATLEARHVLVADDLAAARDAARDMLLALGMRVTVVPSGAAARAAITLADEQRDGFDIVLLDLRMPDGDGLETARRLNAINLRQPPTLMLIADAEDAEIRAQAERAGFRAVLAKPLTASMLYDQLSELQDGTTPAARPGPLPADSSLLGQQHGGARLLLAEDNVINQEVAVELLLGAGFQVDLACNGEEAVKLACEAMYDLILMDVQMPVLDGLDASRAIRAVPGRERVPILAMTANAFEEDRQQCLAAGMNDHIGKPVDPDALFKTLMKWLPRREAVSTAPAAPMNEPQPEPDELLARLSAIAGLDVKAGLKYALGRPPTYARRLLKYADAHAEQIEHAARHYADGQPKEAERLVHSLKGAAGFIGASRIYALADTMEDAIRNQESKDSVAKVAAPLAAAQAQLVMDIRTHLGSLPIEQHSPVRTH